MDARQIIDEFGGHATLAEIIGEDGSITARWAETGAIPLRWQAKLFMLAKKRGLALTASDFVGAPIPVITGPATNPPPLESAIGLGPIVLLTN